MSAPEAPSGVGTPYSYALVGAQFLLIALLASPLGAFVPDSPRAAIGLSCLLAAFGLAAAAAASLRRANFSVLPEPVAGGALVERGPYRHVRHPMYAAVLLAGTGAAIANADAAHTLGLLLLGVVLWLKIEREERFLETRYPGYADYRRRVKALVPRVL